VTKESEKDEFNPGQIKQDFVHQGEEFVEGAE
jgi:hypothetical protein